MLVRNIAQLAVYKTDKNTEALPLACLRGLFTEKASDIIYIIVERKLYGIICLEDILYHSDRNRVQINKRDRKSVV